MKKLGNLIFGLVLLIALAGAVILAGRSQDTRKSAYFAGANLSLQPTTKTLTTNEVFPVQLWVETGVATGSSDKAKVDGVSTYVCYDNRKLAIGDTAGVLNTTTMVFDTVQYVSVVGGTYPSGINECLRLAVTSNKPVAELSSGAVYVAKLMFKAIGSGTTGAIIIDRNNSVVSGNSATTDTSMSIDSASGLTYTIAGGSGPTNTPIPETGTWPVLKYLISYRNVVSGNMCATGWPVVITVMAPNGTKKVYTAQVPVRDTSITNKVAYRGQLTLTDFPYYQNLAIFIKGPKHLQNKYGVNNQTAYYNQAGGAITLTSNAATTVVQDFTGYPLMPGDLTGATSGVQDGMVDGRDWSYLKVVADRRDVVGNGQYLLTDLDGNCQVAGMDTSFFILTLKDKLEQLY